MEAYVWVVSDVRTVLRTYGAYVHTRTHAHCQLSMYVRVIDLRSVSCQTYILDAASTTI